MSDTTLTVRENGEGKFTQEITVGRHRLIADEPASVGGGDLGPGPYDYLLAGLGACTSMTMRMYANHKKWPLEGVTVTLSHGRIHAKDCEDCETEKGLVSEIRREISISGPELSEDQLARLMEIADRCPVHRTLSSEIKIRTVAR
jgi:putative redox protein